MNYYNKNIEEIKKQGFESMNFGGYGGTGYKKGGLEIWWGEWGNAYLKTDNSKKKIDLCQISTEPIKDKLIKALVGINCL